MLKLLYVVLDGMADLPIRELGNRTPLAAADTPHMDLLARKGKTGLMYTVGRGFAPESDAAVISILGHDPIKSEASRGVMESIGSGVSFNDGDLALRCNFATFGPDGQIIDRRAGRDLTADETAGLSEAINGGVMLTSHPARFTFKNTIGHRGVLVIRGEGFPLSGRVTNTDPAYARVGGIGVVNPNPQMNVQRCEPMDATETAKVSAVLVNEFVEKSHRILNQSRINTRRLAETKLSANGILTRDAGHRLPRFLNINDRYAVNFCCLADMPLEIGIAQLVGMHLIPLPAPSGDLKADCQLRARKLFSVLKSYECFYIHIKGPDEPGHDGDYLLKTEMIATIDKHFFGEVLSRISVDDFLFCVTSDHATPCTLKAHSDDPVPLLVVGGDVQADDNAVFSETSCKSGSLGVIERGSDLMPILMTDLKRA